AAAVRSYGLDDVGPARSQAVDHLVGARAEGVRYRGGSLNQKIHGCISVRLNGLRRARAALLDAADDVLRIAADRATRPFGRFRDPFGHTVAVRAERIDERGLRRVDAVDEIGASLVDLGQQGFAGRLDAAVDLFDPSHDVVGGLAAGFAEPSGEAFADAHDRDRDLSSLEGNALDRARTGAVHRKRDFLGRCAERRRKALARLAEPLAQALARSVEVARNAGMRV